MAVEDTTTRAWKATRDAEAGLFISKDRALLAGDSKHFVAVDRNGVTTKGPTSDVSLSTERREGGLFLGLGEFMEMIPSTIVSPIPNKIPVPPIVGIVNVLADVAFFAAVLL